MPEPDGDDGGVLAGADQLRGREVPEITETTGDSDAACEPIERPRNDIGIGRRAASGVVARM
jgi:hypothetical protein